MLIGMAWLVSLFGGEFGWLANKRNTSLVFNQNNCDNILSYRLSFTGEITAIMVAFQTLPHPPCSVIVFEDSSGGTCRVLGSKSCT